MTNFNQIPILIIIFVGDLHNRLLLKQLRVKQINHIQDYEKLF